MKEKAQWYAESLKQKEKSVNNLNNEMVGLATENDDLSAENKRLKEELADSRDAVPRGRTT